MYDLISPKYAMRLIKEIVKAIELEYFENSDREMYLERWHTPENDFYENFSIKKNAIGEIDLYETISSMEEDLLLKVAVDMGVPTPDYIPSVANFRYEIRSDYKHTSSTFEKAIRQIETYPDNAIDLAHSALESIVKEILRDERIKTKPKDRKTLYELTEDLLKELQLFPKTNMPVEMKIIGSSLLTINQSIEKLRSEKTNMHGKTDTDYIIEDEVFAYFIVNSVTTIGLFLNSIYKKQFPDLNPNTSEFELPF